MSFAISPSSNRTGLLTGRTSGPPGLGIIAVLQVTRWNLQNKKKKKTKKKKKNAYNNTDWQTEKNAKTSWKIANNPDIKRATVYEVAHSSQYLADPAAAHSSNYNEIMQETNLFVPVVVDQKDVLLFLVQLGICNFDEFLNVFQVPLRNHRLFGLDFFGNVLENPRPF